MAVLQMCPKQSISESLGLNHMKLYGIYRKANSVRLHVWKQWLVLTSPLLPVGENISLARAEANVTHLGVGGVSVPFPSNLCPLLLVAALGLVGAGGMG